MEHSHSIILIENIWENHRKPINFGGTESFRQTPFATETHPVTSSPRTAAAAEAIDRTKRLPREKKCHGPRG